MNREGLILKISVAMQRRIVVWRSALHPDLPCLSYLERCVKEGDNPVRDNGRPVHEALSKSRVVWECSPKRVVNSI